MTSTGQSTGLSLLSFCQLVWMIPATLKFSNNVCNHCCVCKCFQPTSNYSEFIEIEELHLKLCFGMEGGDTTVHLKLSIAP